MLPFFLFCIYLTTNLGSLLLASAAQKKKTKFLNSSAVALSEAIKCAMSLLMIWAARRGANAQSMSSTIYRTLFADPKQMLKVCIPAMLYTIQNNVIYTALSHLDAVTFQIVYQLKIVAALVCHRFLLGKRVSAMRWLSVMLLTIGVVLVQLSTAEPSPAAAAAASSSSSSPAAATSSSDASCSTDPLPSSSANTATSSTDASSSSAAAASSSSGVSAADAPLDESKKRTLGFAAVLVACMCSGLAGAVMEGLLKSDAQSLGTRNLQVGVVSLVLAMLHLLSNDAHRLREGGFFQGYTPLVWSMVTLDSAGGMLVSMLLKYTSATLKNFAAPLGIILNILLSRLRAKGDAPPPKPKFLLGAALVILALGLFTASPA